MKKSRHFTSHLADLFPVGWALRQTFQKGYGLADFKNDFLAGLVVSMIALPLSMALAIAIGLPPQHGIYTAIVAGIVAALCGGSLYQVSGPTAAFVVILIPIVSELGLRGLIWCQILAGFILILFAIARLGKLIQYIPYPVVTGFTAGIALVLATLSLKDFLGLQITSLGPHFIDKVTTLLSHFDTLSPYTMLIGMTTLLLMIGSRRFIKIIPSPIIGVIGGTLLGLLLTKNGIPIATIGSEFHFVDIKGLLQNGVPPYPPAFHLPNFMPGDLFSLPSFNELKILIAPAFTIAALAALETLLSATIADNLTQSRHHPNAELHGIGIANILTGFASGIPATAAIARTATNIHQGAQSPFAAVLQGVLILIYVSIFSSLIAYIPMSTLAAILLLTAYNMSHLKQCRSILCLSPIADKIVLVACFTLTVCMDMVAGVTVGIVLATLFSILPSLPARET